MEWQSLDHSKAVLWVPLCQRAAKLPAGKVGGLKKILPCGQGRVSWSQTWPRGRIFFKPPTLPAGNLAAL